MLAAMTWGGKNTVAAPTVLPCCVLKCQRFLLTIAFASLVQLSIQYKR